MKEFAKWKRLKLLKSKTGKLFSTRESCLKDEYEAEMRKWFKEFAVR